MEGKASAVPKLRIAVRLYRLWKKSVNSDNFAFSSTAKAGGPYLTAFLRGDVGNARMLSVYSLGDWTELLPLHRERSEISHISRGEIWGTRLGGRGKCKMI
jgi:hypothetical protein